MKRKMKKVTKSILCMALCMAMLAPFTGCGDSSGDNKNKGNGVHKTEEADNITFPLEEEVTFNFMVKGTETTSFKSQLENNALWKKLKEDTNVNVEFTFLGSDASTKLSLLANSGGYGDVLVGGPILNSIDSSLYLASGILVPLTDYVNESYMPNLMNIIEKNPDIMKNITSAEGEVVTIPKVTELDGWYLESPLWINKKWLDKLNLSVPTTVEEFANVLRAFYTQDPNGNGEQDEIPLFISTSLEYYNFEALMGIYGVATKSGTNDSYVQVKDGKVEFAPATDGYKAALTWLSQLYQEGLIYDEAFTAASSTAMAKLTATTCVVGAFTSNSVPTTEYCDDYICIAPPKAEGYTPCWYYHYGINGAKNLFYVTDKCENIGILMKWMDRFYELETAMALEYGYPGEGRIELDENGKYSYIELGTIEASKLNESNPALTSLTSFGMRAITSDDYANRINLSKAEQIKQSCYQIYNEAGVINQEIWPRPYYPAEDANRISSFSTDLYYQVELFRSKCITGLWDVESKWEEYVGTLRSIGLEEFLEVQQKAYDAYMGTN